MKHLFLFMSLSLCVNLFATIRTVNNNPGTVAQFTTIQAAVTASANGDTVYVHGSPVQYAGFTITDKRLVVIGPGRSPLQDFMPYPATVYSLDIAGSGSSNTEIQGLYFVTSVTIATSNYPNNLRFIRNYFGSSVTIAYGTNNYSGYVFESNWFSNTGFSCAQSCFYTNFVIKNNVFFCNNSNLNASGLYNSNSVIFDHNLFYGPPTGTTPVFGSGCRNLLLTNNIFVRRNATTNLTNSVFHKNITFNCGSTNPWDTAGNTGSDNFASQDPHIVDSIAVNSGINNPLLNFSIVPGTSPASNSGTDGKNIGLLFDLTGSLNWANSRMSRLPFVYSMNISNPNIPAGGTLNVQVEARKNN